MISRTRALTLSDPLGLRIGPRPHVQFFQPFSQIIPAGQASHAVLTAWAVNSQKGQNVADPRSQLHNTHTLLDNLICSKFADPHGAVVALPQRAADFSRASGISVPSEQGSKSRR